MSSDSRPPRSDTNRTAPRRFLIVGIPLALLALVVLLVGMHFLGQTK
jgi:hypothetical protein